MRSLAAWRPVGPDLPLLNQAWFLQQRYALSWWDALIVAAAQSSECSVLLTEDLQHDQVLGEIRVINPFRSPERTPSEVLDALNSLWIKWRERRERRGARLTRRAREEYLVYFDRSATMSDAKRRVSAGMDRRLNAA